MDASQIRILFLSHASLSTGFVVGSHQLAKCYAKQYQTYHVSSPVTPFHFLKGKAGIKKIKSSLFPKFKKDFGFTDYVPLVPFPYGLFGWTDKINDWCVSLYFRILNIPLNYDVVLIDQPSFIDFYTSRLSSRNMFYRPTDIYKEMGGGKYEFHEKNAVAECDGIIATSKEVLTSLGQKAAVKPNIVLENGVDFEYFSKRGQELTRKGFVYVGAVDFRFDIDFLIKLARHFPNETFDIFGAVSIEVDSTKLPKNLRLKGGIDYSEVPKLLHVYKYGLIPLNGHPANIGRSPMKLYEYKAAGLITLVRESKKYRELECTTVLTYRSVDEAVEKVNSTITINPVDYQNECIESARKQSWERKANLLMDFIGLEN
ncbi:glycosyltransferase family protein [Alteromonas sp.]|uniref:glycosyltransferase family protein n=1 Tax=Alteromonas sp. TaxID=232 RepID=UPI00258096EB|nr:hypothetical protein [Alteromonas sp.]NQY17004.1 hypothetical protein [Alteromonas sp.]